MARRAAALAACFVAGGATAAEMNISQFVFRDVDRNGVYDAGESPFAGASIVLTRDGRDRIVRESNLSGFANFPMSSDEEADITAPGTVTFAIQVPDGFVLTTGNPAQDAEIIAVDGAPSGLAMTPPMRFVGLAPRLTIESSAEGVSAMTCFSTGREVDATRVGETFSCDVGPGIWSIAWDMDDGTVRKRDVSVGAWPVRVPPAEVAAAGNVEHTVTFDDEIASENIQEMPARDGFVWHNTVAVHEKFYGAWGYVNGRVSGEFAAYNSSGHPATLSSDAPFDVHGMYVSVAWPAAMQAPVRIAAYRDGARVGEDAFIASNLRPIWFAPGWTGIDELVISHDQYWQVVIDDLQLSR